MTADDSGLWQPLARRSYLQAAQIFSDRLKSHIAFTAEMTDRDEEWPAYFASVEQLAGAGRDFDVAELRWCGSIPLGVTPLSDEDDEDEEDTTNSAH